MIKATRYLVAILSVASCSTDAIDSTSTTGPTSVFRIQTTERAGDGVPYFIKGALGVATSPIRELGDVDLALSTALPDIGRAIGVPADQMVATRVEHDSLGMTHVRYAQRARGFEVVSGVVIVHVAASGIIESVSNGMRDASGMPTVPSIAATAAADLARAQTPKAAASTAPDLVYVITNADGDLHFAWRTDVTGPMLHDTVFVDATTGQVVARHPHIQPTKSRTIFSGADIDNSGNLNGGTQVATEGSPPTDQGAKFAYDNTGTTYDCYKEMFQRDSYDNAGATLISYVHTTNNGGAFLNAFWDSTEMVYGNGDGVEFGDFAAALDVTAHELTHAVTEHTAALVYQDESGGLNEATSDILGNSCEAHHAGQVSANTWLVGEDIFTPGTPGDALRYMNNPTLDASLYPPGSGEGSIDFYGDYQQGIDVHFSSGVANLFYYLLVQGGTHPRTKTPYTNVGIGIDKAEQIWYRALTTYFMPNTNFAQARTATEKAATDLFPGATKNVVGMAWATVGVGTAPVDNVAPTIMITSPGDGMTVEQGFTVTVDASDDQGVVRVDFSIDGAVVGSAATAPYTFTSATALPFGSHVIEATAHDAVNMASDSVTVNLIDPTCGNVCTADQLCDMTTGMCVANPDAGGCCSTGGDGRGALLLFAGTALVLVRRRRRK